jgi:hypothetical protein
MWSLQKTTSYEKELRALGQIISGYLDFAERQAEREQSMNMEDWAAHLDRILTMSGENLLQGAGKISHEQALEKATAEYKKYQAKTLMRSREKLSGQSEGNRRKNGE